MLNFPDALPEEAFIFFQKLQAGNDELSVKQAFLNEVLHRHLKSQYQEHSKGVYRNDAFTERIQEKDPREEQLRSEVMSEFNDLESMRGETEAEVKSYINIKAKAEKLLGFKLTPQKLREAQTPELARARSSSFNYLEGNLRLKHQAQGGLEQIAEELKSDRVSKKKSGVLLAVQKSEALPDRANVNEEVKISEEDDSQVSGDDSYEESESAEDS